MTKARTKKIAKRLLRAKLLDLYSYNNIVNSTQLNNNNGKDIIKNVFINMEIERVLIDDSFDDVDNLDQDIYNDLYESIEYAIDDILLFFGVN